MDGSVDRWVGGPGGRSARGAASRRALGPDTEAGPALGGGGGMAGRFSGKEAFGRSPGRGGGSGAPNDSATGGSDIPGGPADGPGGGVVDVDGAPAGPGDGVAAQGDVDRLGGGGGWCAGPERTVRLGELNVGAIGWSVP